MHVHCRKEYGGIATNLHRGYKPFSMHTLAEHEILPANKNQISD